MPGAGAADDQGGGEVSGKGGMDQAVGEAGVEDDLKPAGRGDELTHFVERPADRGLHPAVDAEDPESGDEGAGRHHQGRGEVKPLAHSLHPEQHHAEEAGFEEEGGEDLIGHERPDDRAGPVREDRPVGAELVGHDDSGDDAHREGQGEDLQPVSEQVEIGLLAGLQPKPLEHGEIGGQADREGREDEVERDRERELGAGEDQGSVGIGHVGAPFA